MINHCEVHVKRGGEEANRNVLIYRSWTGSWTAGFWKQDHYFVTHYYHDLQAPSKHTH